MIEALLEKRKKMEAEMCQLLDSGVKVTESQRHAMFHEWRDLDDQLYILMGDESRRLSQFITIICRKEEKVLILPDKVH